MNKWRLMSVARTLQKGEPVYADCPKCKQVAPFDSALILDTSSKKETKQFVRWTCRKCSYKFDEPIGPFKPN